MNGCGHSAIETVRREVIGPYGCQEKLIPFLNSLKTVSVLFARAYAVTTYTQASFPDLLIYPGLENIDDMLDDLEQSAEKSAKAFRYTKIKKSS
jgi:glucan phosphoethanolaminetransferase (alkaline phosphatase superfamily)